MFSEVTMVKTTLAAGAPPRIPLVAYCAPPDPLAGLRKRGWKRGGEGKREQWKDGRRGVEK